MKRYLILLATALLSAAVVLLSQRLDPRIQRLFHPPSEAKLALRPIAEFEPSFGVALSEHILFQASGVELVREIIRARGKIYLFTTESLQDETEELFQVKKPFSPEEMDAITKIQLEHESLWLRDFLPIPVLRVYPRLPPTPSFVDFVYRDGNSFDDAAIHQFALAINSSVEHLPIVLDGGNFMTDGESCILSEEMSADPDAPSFVTGDASLDQHVAPILDAAMGCQRTFVVSQRPHPHVDMWIKFARKGTVLINEIEEESLSLASELEPGQLERIRKIKIALDETAVRLGKAFRVIRLPMPLPVNDIFFTYANSVIVNDTVIIPSYQDPEPKRGSYPDRTLYPKYETRVAEAFRSLGFRPVFLNGDELIKEGGAFHCVTFHLPDLDAIMNDKSQLAIRPKK
jgi:agmatine/peptidylarginine deiminase